MNLPAATPSRLRGAMSLTPRKVAWMQALSLVLIACAALCLPAFAYAGLPDKPAAVIENVVTMLTRVGVGIFTAACMWVGYKMAFAGAQFRDVSNILWGGVLAGGAAGFAGWLFG